MARRTLDGLFKRCTCQRRAWPKCRHAWWMTFGWRGVSYRFSLAPFYTTKDGSCTRTEAANLRDECQRRIRAGELTPSGKFVKPLEPVADDVAPPTLEQLLEQYERDHVAAPGRRTSALAAQRAVLKQIKALTCDGASGQPILLVRKLARDITAADLESVRAHHRARHAEAQNALQTLATAETPLPPETVSRLAPLARLARRSGKSGEVAMNRLLARLRHVFSWSIRRGLLDATPFRRHGVVTVSLTTAVEGHRTRRLEGDERARLMAAAGPHLKLLITAALATGARKGELLALTWADVRLDAAGVPTLISFPAAKTKTNQAAAVPITPRLGAQLAMTRAAHLAALNEPDAAKAEALLQGLYVFGTALGTRVQDIKTAWRATCARAGVTGLHFHDLRREVGSRILETGGSLHDAQAVLRHGNTATTSKYLQSTTSRLAAILTHLDDDDDTDPPAQGATSEPPAWAATATAGRPH